jgi:hypothetical protein
MLARRSLARPAASRPPPPFVPRPFTASAKIGEEELVIPYIGAARVKEQMFFLPWIAHEPCAHAQGRPSGGDVPQGQRGRVIIPSP